MSMTMRQLLVLILSTLLFTGCYRQCDNFNTGILDWMPYKEGDLITLSDSLNVMTLSVISSSVNHTEKVRFFSMCACSETFTVTLSSDTVELAIWFFDSSRPSASDAHIGDEYFHYSESLESLSFGDHTYFDVIKLRNPTGHDINEILIAKSIGIIALKGESGCWRALKTDPGFIEIADINYSVDNCD